MGREDVRESGMESGVEDGREGGSEGGGDGGEDGGGEGVVEGDVGVTASGISATATATFTEQLLSLVGSLMFVTVFSTSFLRLFPSVSVFMVSDSAVLSCIELSKLARDVTGDTLIEELISTEGSPGSRGGARYCGSEDAECVGESADGDGDVL